MLMIPHERTHGKVCPFSNFHCLGVRALLWRLFFPQRKTFQYIASSKQLVSTSRMAFTRLLVTYSITHNTLSSSTVTIEDFRHLQARQEKGPKTEMPGEC